MWVVLPLVLRSPSFFRVVLSPSLLPSSLLTLSSPLCPPPSPLSLYLSFGVVVLSPLLLEWCCLLPLSFQETTVAVDEIVHLNWGSQNMCAELGTIAPLLVPCCAELGALRFGNRVFLLFSCAEIRARSVGPNQNEQARKEASKQADDHLVPEHHLTRCLRWSTRMAPLVP